VLTCSSGTDWCFLNKDGDGDRRKQDSVMDLSNLEALFAKDMDLS